MGGLGCLRPQTAFTNPDKTTSCHISLWHQWQPVKRHIGHGFCCSAFLTACVGSQINTSAANFVLVLAAVAVAVDVCRFCNVDQELFLDRDQFWCDPSLAAQGSLHKYNMAV